MMTERIANLEAPSVYCRRLSLKKERLLLLLMMSDSCLDGACPFELLLLLSCCTLVHPTAADLMLARCSPMLFSILLDCLTRLGSDTRVVFVETGMMGCVEDCAAKIFGHR